MNLLVTGATGFIGSHLINTFLQNNHRLFCTLLQNEKNPFGEEKVKSVYLNYNDINEFIEFLKMNSIEGIIHLASFVQSSQHKLSDIEAIIDANIKFGSILLEAAVQGDVKWMINTGTYWQNIKCKEYSPVNLYAASKQAFQDIAKYYIDSNKIRFCTIKLFDTYGPNDTRPKIFNLWHKIAKTGEIIDMTPGEQIIDITHINDVVSAFVLLSYHLHNNNRDIVNGTVYIVKAKKRYKLKELAKIFENAAGQKLNINWGGRPYGVREIMKPLSEGETIPNWIPQISLEEGIKQTFYS